MWHLFTMLFSPPPMPEIDLPFLVRTIPGVKILISQAFELAYYRGVFDGFVAGVLATLLLVPSTRSQAKGHTHVKE
jgi:hypothetical protein